MDGNIHLVDCKGKLNWKYNTGDEVTQVLIADLDNDGNEEIFAGSMSFNIYVLNGEGKKIWRKDSGDVVRVLAIKSWAGAKEMVVGSEDGYITVFDNKGKEVARFSAESPIIQVVLADLTGDEKNKRLLPPLKAAIFMLWSE